METFRAIMTRRSIGKVKQDRPPREAIEKILEAAVQAPNHHLSEPWRFFVLAGSAREELGRVLGDALRGRLDDPEGEPGRTQVAKEMEKPLRAPVLIVVASKKSDNPKVLDIEDVEATAAAVQNMLLAAHNLGLGAMWRTGDAAYDPAVKRLFDLGPEDHISGFIYVGFPDMDPKPRKRAHASEKTEWRGWGQE